MTLESATDDLFLVVKGRHLDMTLVNVENVTLECDT